MKKKTNTLRAFRSRNYRLYFAGQSVSLIGTWMQRTAVSWVVYSMTHSPFMLGLTMFASQFPSFLLSLYGGVVSDRYHRYKVVLITQIASMIQATLLAVLVLFQQATVWEILTLSVLLGVINAFDVPIRQSMIYEMVETKEDLPNALALNSSMVNLAILIGPAIAGIVLEKFGEAVCFLLNAASFIAVIASFVFMKLPEYTPRVTSKKVMHEIREGWAYLHRTPSIGVVILMLAFVSLIVLPYNTLLPVYAKVIFKGSASTFGYLNSAIGFGAMGGTFFLASRKDGSNLKKILLINTFIFGGALMVFSQMTNFYAALLFAAIAGFGRMSQTTICNTLIQTTVEPAMRGRIISFFVMAFFGMLPIGSLLIGTVSQYIGAPMTILFEGIAALIIALAFSQFLRSDSLKNDEVVTLEERGVEAV